MAQISVPMRRTLAEGASRVLLNPYIAKVLRAIARHDHLPISELVERALVLYVATYHPEWKKPSSSTTFTPEDL